MKLLKSLEENKEEIKMTELQALLMNNGSVMESFYDMRLAQDPKDRMNYFDIVLEGTVETNAQLLQKLYTDIMSKSNIDFGAIPDSKGNLTAYKEYGIITTGMDYLNKLFEGKECEEVQLMNKLHDMIISCRKDYEFGYTRDIEIVKLSYCTAVYSLHEMINLCVLIYTRMMRENAGIQFDFKKTKKKNLLLLKSVKGMIKSYDSGQWATFMSELKKNPSLFNGAVASPATEAGPISIIVDSKNLGEVVKGAGTFLLGMPKPLVWVIAAIGIFFAIRYVIYLFFKAAKGVRDSAKTNKEFIEFSIEQEKEEGAPDSVITKHQKLADRLERLAVFIETKLLKENAEATKDIEKTNRTNYAPSEFNNPAFGGDITF